jgi:hypothetical protein
VHGKAVRRGQSTASGRDEFDESVLRIRIKAQYRPRWFSQEISDEESLIWCLR